MITYEQYVNRLREWTTDYLDYVSARIEFDQMISVGFTLEESFQIVLTGRLEDYSHRNMGA